VQSSRGRTACAGQNLLQQERADRIESQALPPLYMLVLHPIRRLLSGSVNATCASAKSVFAAVEPIIICRLCHGLGEGGEPLAPGMDRAAARLIGLVTEEQRRFASKPRFTNVTELVEPVVNASVPVTSRDRRSIHKGRYVGLVVIYAQVSGSISTERDLGGLSLMMLLSSRRGRDRAYQRSPIPGPCWKLTTLTLVAAQP